MGDLRKRLVTAAVLAAALVSDPSARELEFIPDINIMVESASFGANSAHYNGYFRRKVQMDILKLNNVSFGIISDESTILGGTGERSGEAYILRHNMNYFYARVDKEDRSMTLFYDHLCDNGVMRPYAERGWDVVGFSLETKNMLQGHLNDGIDFDSGKEREFLSRFAYRLSLTRTIWARGPEARANADFLLRWDIMRIRKTVPYASARFYPAWRSEFTRNYELEMGLRFNTRTVFFAPFAAYRREHNLEGWGQGSETFFLAGARFGSLNGIDAKLKAGKEYLPRLRLKGHYANLPGTKDFEFNSNVELGVDFLKSRDFRFFFNTKTETVSPGNVWRPRFAFYRLEPGAAVEVNDISLEIFWRRDARYDINTSGNPPELNGFLGLRAQSSGMLRRDFLQKLDWRTVVGKYFYTSEYDYKWNAEFTARLNLLHLPRHIGKTPYVEGNLNLLSGRKLDRDYYVEGGVRFHGREGDIILFARRQRWATVDKFGGRDKEYMLFGIRFEL